MEDVDAREGRVSPPPGRLTTNTPVKKPTIDPQKHNRIAPGVDGVHFLQENILNMSFCNFSRGVPY